MRLWQNMVSGVDELRLDVALKMLKSPHFNAKMNSLKEVCIRPICNLLYLSWNLEPFLIECGKTKAISLADYNRPKQCSEPIRIKSNSWHQVQDNTCASHHWFRLCFLLVEKVA